MVNSLSFVKLNFHTYVTLAANVLAANVLAADVLAADLLAADVLAAGINRLSNYITRRHRNRGTKEHWNYR